MGLIEAPRTGRLEPLVDGERDLVVPSPGCARPIPGVRAAAARRPVLERDRAGRPNGSDRCRVVAITGTNGKTTVTTLVTAMLEASGRRAVAAGNIGLPLIEAVESRRSTWWWPRCRRSSSSSPSVPPRGQLLAQPGPRPSRLASDLDHYAAAKARIWANQRRATRRSSTPTTRSLRARGAEAGGTRQVFSAACGPAD